MYIVLGQSNPPPHDRFKGCGKPPYETGEGHNSMKRWVIRVKLSPLKPACA